MNLLMVRKIISAFLVPPGLFIILILTALFLFRKKSWKAAASLLWFVVLLVTVFSSFAGEYLFLRPLEESFEPVETGELTRMREDGEKTVIVVLAGDMTRKNDSENTGDVGEATLKRLFGGFNVYQETGLPICVSGGIEPGAKGGTLAGVMGETLEAIGVPPERIIYEDKSRTTWENAEYSIKLLKSQGFKRIILVTDAVHMRRSVMCFSGQGMEVIPFPSGFLYGTPSLIDWLPNIDSLSKNLRALHEWGGLVYYRIRY